MIVRNYNLFLFEMLCESVLMTNGEFISFLRDISDNKISQALLDIISSQKDIKTTYNGLSMSDKNDEISFIPDSQFQRGIKAGEDPWIKAKSQAKVGRLVRQILNDNGGEFNDSKIEEFVNTFKSVWDKKYSTTKKVEVVTGDKILHWYNQNNYESSNGSLGSSCMRHASKNHFMKIYADNPDKISLVVVTESNKLIARSLLWKIEVNGEKKIYLDRIYTKNDSDQDFVKNWVINNVSPNILYYGNLGDQTLICELKKTTFDHYPYMDTFDNIYHKLTPEKDKYEGSGFVSNKKLTDKYQEYVLCELEDTDGGEYIESHVYSNASKKYIIRSKAIYIDYIGDYIDKSDAIECNYNGNYYLKDQVVYSETMQDWIPKANAIQHPKFGLVYDRAVISVILEYKGDDKSPATICQKIFDDEMDDFILEDGIKGVNNFVSSKSPSRKWTVFANDSKTTDAGGYNVSSMLCYKTFRIDDDVPNDILDIIGRCDYITELESKFFKINISTRSKEYYVNDYLSYRQSYFMFNFDDNKDKYGDELIRKEISDEYKKMHDFRYKMDRYYRNEYNTEKSLRDINPDKVVLELSKEAIKKSISRSRVFDKFEVSEDKRELVTNLLQLYSAIHFVSNSRRTCNTIISKYVREKMNDVYQELVDLDIFIKLDSIFEYLEDRFTDHLYDLVGEYKDERDINIYTSNFIDILSKKCSTDNLIELFSKV